MPQRSSKKKARKKRPTDENQLAKSIVDEAVADVEEAVRKAARIGGMEFAGGRVMQTGEPEKNPAAVALGRLGGKKGGPARAKKLTKKRRSEIAKKAAEARWQKKKKQPS